MGLKHKAKKGTVIEANGVKVTVLRGSPELEITAPENVAVSIGRPTAQPSRWSTRSRNKNSQYPAKRLRSRRST